MNKSIKRLKMTRETLRVLVHNELAKIEGGVICESRVGSGCSTTTDQKCENRPNCAG